MHRATSTERPAESEPELRRVTRELRALQRRFQAIIERTADGILVVARDGVIRFANESAGRLFGRDAPDLVGTPFGTPLSENTMEIDLVRPGEPVVAELRVMDTDWDGESARLVSLRDITDRRRSEERARRLFQERLAREQAEQAAHRASFLAEASRRLAASLEMEPTLQTVAALVTEELADYCIIDLVRNRAVRRVVSAGDDPGRASLVERAAAYPLDIDSASPLARVCRTCQPLRVADVTDEWLRTATTGEDHLELARELGTTSLVVVPLHAGSACSGVITMGSWRRDRHFDERQFQIAIELGRIAAMAIENARLYTEAEAANRAKSNFLSVMSHELRTPLSAVIGYTDLMDRGVAGEPTDQQRHFLGRIRASSNHLLQIIEQILSFAGTAAGAEKLSVERVTLQELMDGVLAIAEPLAQDTDLEFAVTVEDGETELETDPRKVRQVLLNLISNALKFTPEGSVRVSAHADGDQAVFVVEDSGVGISKEARAHIFEQFWQAEDPMTRKAGGMGLGLAVVRSFTELLRGRIDVVSEVGDGSTFTVTVPLSVPR